MAKAKLTIPYQNLSEVELGSVSIELDETEVDVEIPDEMLKEIVRDYFDHNDFTSHLEARLLKEGSATREFIARAVFDVLASGGEGIEKAIRAIVVSVYNNELGEGGKLADTIRRVLVSQVINEDGLIDFKDSLSSDETVVSAMIRQLQQEVPLLELVLAAPEQYHVYCKKVGVEHDQAIRVRDMFREAARIALDKMKQAGGEPFDHLNRIAGEEETTE